jgi:hypothetical protein
MYSIRSSIGQRGAGGSRELKLFDWPMRLFSDMFPALAYTAVRVCDTRGLYADEPYSMQGKEHRALILGLYFFRFVIP